MNENRVRESLNIVRSFVENKQDVPPLVVGFTESGEAIALRGTYSTVEEQIKFANLVHLSFLLHGIEEYHYIAPYHMLTLDKSAESDAFLEELRAGTKTLKANFASEPVIMVASVTHDGKEGGLYKANLGVPVPHLQPVLNFSTTNKDTADELMLALLPKKGLVIPEEAKKDIENLIEAIRYRPKVEEREVNPEVAEILAAMQPEEVETEEDDNDSANDILAVLAGFGS